MQIDFNASFGDLLLTRAGDISMLQGDQETIQAIQCLLKSEYKDYKYAPYFGANFNKWLGKPVTPQLASEIQAELEAKTGQKVLFYIENNAIFFRIYVNGVGKDFSFTRDKGVVPWTL